MAAEHFDVIIIGAGISGIGAACHLQQKCPGKHYAILEGRETLGGTWDLFRYPGIRSDSDMYTLGYAFKPWNGRKTIADAPDILNYLHETVAEYGLDQRIRYRHRLESAAWSTRDARWELEISRGPDEETLRMTCGFLHMCSGYYSYEKGYTPQFAAMESFRGQIVHPQAWPEDLDYDGKRVVVIGSGATAVTLVPAIAERAAHVTMLQRSPTYMVSAPATDRLAGTLNRRLPAALAYAIIRWRNILLQRLVYAWFQRYPRRARRGLIERVRKELGPDYDVDTHFTPRYNPWDQRLCLVADSDLFAAIRDNRASVVTDTIDHFTPQGLQLDSGATLEADLIVTATGLNLAFLSNVAFTVDGKPLQAGESLIYRGMMVGGVPNMALSMGYTNASWTLRCDLTCDYVCRLLNHMDRHGYRYSVANSTLAPSETEPYMTLEAGYIERARHLLPRQGPRSPWKLHQNYFRDIFNLRYSRLEDGVLAFG